jgi:hypothetical protein
MIHFQNKEALKYWEMVREALPEMNTAERHPQSGARGLIGLFDYLDSYGCRTEGGERIPLNDDHPMRVVVTPGGFDLPRYSFNLAFEKRQKGDNGQWGEWVVWQWGGAVFTRGEGWTVHT